jgi:hypothetical protein
MLYVPLGMRCSTASIVRSRAKLVGPALPFDWCQMNSDSMAEWIINCNRARWIKSYFKKFDHTTHINDRGDYFPHEDWSDKTTGDKYVRRGKRLHEIMKSSEDKTFIMMWSRNCDLERLYPVLEQTCKGTINFITFNQPGNDVTYPNHDNFNVVFHSNWPQWEEEVSAVLKSHLGI